MLFTFPSRYWFAIGLSGGFSLTGWSRLIHAEFLVLRATQDTTIHLILTCTGLSPSTACLSKQVPVQIFQEYRGPTTPITPKRYRFGLFRVRSPLLAESQLFSLPAGTKMFQFPAFALPIRKYLVFNQVGYPIRKSPDQWSFAPTRSLSQLTTSFIASQSQGIHRSLFLSFSYAKIVVLRLTRNPSFLFTL